MTENALSRAIADRGVAVGCMLFEFDTPRVMRLLAAAGADFALFDLEHTAWDVESLGPSTRTSPRRSTPARAGSWRR